MADRIIKKEKAQEIVGTYIAKHDGWNAPPRVKLMPDGGFKVVEKEVPLTKTQLESVKYIFNQIYNESVNTACGVELLVGIFGKEYEMPIAMMVKQTRFFHIGAGDAAEKMLSIYNGDFETFFKTKI